MRNNTASTEDDLHIVKQADGADVCVFDPYNPLNISIEKHEVEAVLRNYGINAPIHNMDLYKRAFIHRSYMKRPDLENQQNNITIAPKPDNCLPLSSKSNERLEFVGDGVLECITKYYLYRRFPKENEGFMTEKKIELVKNESIGRIAQEMGLNKWFVLSKHAEQKQTRNNLKKLGCLFESFVGALFLDFNKITVNDSENWFNDVFVCGPGFQMAQIFIESVFESHVDWINLIKNDNNYKNILQVIIQKEFKVTPHYLEQSSSEDAYHMGVYLCLGQPIHEAKREDAIPLSRFAKFSDVHEYMSVHKRLFVFLGEGKHKTKKKAEQIACENAISVLRNF